MDYKSLYPWEPPNLLTETSSFTFHEKIVTLRKSKCHFDKEDDWIFLDPCVVDDLICCDEAISPNKPFCYFYVTVFKRVLLRLPLSVFEKELLTELNVAPTQLHPNSWAFVRAFSILCDQLSILPSVDMLLYLFEVKKLGRQLWVSVNSISGRGILTLFQSSYKTFKGHFLKVRANKKHPDLLDGFSLYWTEKPNFKVARRLHKLAPADQEVCKFFTSLPVTFDTAYLLANEFDPDSLKSYTNTLFSL